MARSLILGWMKMIKKGLFKRLKNIEDKNKDQLDAIKKQGEKQLDAIKNKEKSN